MAEIYSYLTADEEFYIILVDLINLPKKRFFTFCHFLRNPTYHRSIFIAFVYVHQMHFFSSRRWSSGAMALGKLPLSGRPTHSDYSKARAYCAYSRCGWGCLDIFLSSILSLSFLPLSGRWPDID